MRTEVDLAAKLFRSLGDPTRLAIVMALGEKEHRVVDLVTRIGCSQANVSAHLACLKDCGLAADRPDGRQVFYRLAEPALLPLLRTAEELLDRQGTRIDLCPNDRASGRKTGPAGC